jgi:hypothetical protein
MQSLNTSGAHAACCSGVPRFSWAIANVLNVQAEIKLIRQNCVSTFFSSPTACRRSVHQAIVKLKTAEERPSDSARLTGLSIRDLNKLYGIV